MSKQSDQPSDYERDHANPTSPWTELMFASAPLYTNDASDGTSSHPDNSHSDPKSSGAERSAGDALFETYNG